MTRCSIQNVLRELQIKGFIEASLTDFPPGQPGAVIFLAGCNARCPYCQAAHLIEGIGKIPSIPLEAVLNALDDLRGFVQGVTITGGEVSLYSNLAETLLVPVRKKGFKIKIDTYGPEPERVQQWIDAGLVQALGIDVKGPWSKYPEILKRSFDQSHLLRIRRWIRYLVEQELACLSNGLMVEFRTTVHPSLIGIQDIFQTAEQIRGASLYVLQNYRPVPGCDESLQRTPSYSLQQLREVAHTIQQKGIIKRCFVRGFEQDALDTESKKACAS